MPSGDPVFNVSEIKNRIDPVRKDPFYLAKNTQIILKIILKNNLIFIFDIILEIFLRNAFIISMRLIAVSDPEHLVVL